ncbi:hypothetical protein GP486_000178 [Trichoglossum hirsutum]|uniref:Uncharacterized protein n=1 Tax=Trichoglossum hirsutum TaxID=265104 RepID=A0A9P8RTT7_9PEZI|nr:hypothetical protein GP486_000178 [Trichoglossum hirsutum]
MRLTISALLLVYTLAIHALTVAQLGSSFLRPRNALSEKAQQRSDPADCLAVKDGGLEKRRGGGGGGGKSGGSSSGGKAGSSSTSGSKNSNSGSGGSPGSSAHAATHSGPLVLAASTPVARRSPTDRATARPAGSLPSSSPSQPKLLLRHLALERIRLPLPATLSLYEPHGHEQHVPERHQRDHSSAVPLPAVLRLRLRWERRPGFRGPATGERESGMNKTVAQVSNLNGATTLVINGTLPNMTDASSAAPTTLEMLISLAWREGIGWWWILGAAVVGWNVLFA